MEINVAERTTALRRLAAHLDSSLEEERRRIARELHDEIEQLGTGLRAEVDLMRVQQSEQGESLDRLDDMTEQLFTSTRRIVSDLRPQILDDLGLAAAVRWYVQRLQARPSPTVSCSIEPEEIQTSSQIAIAVFRTTQEALTNALRHADASQVLVRLSSANEHLTLVVSDDGRGFDVGRTGGEGMGLIGLRERADALGGKLALASSVGSGTRLTLTLPNAMDGSD